MVELNSISDLYTARTWFLNPKFWAYSDLIRCFFIAATDSNTQLAIVGLDSLERLIELFKNSRDPDVEGWLSTFIFNLFNFIVK